jgi:tetratricopeptide (TPR) repeat protein
MVVRKFFVRKEFSALVDVARVLLLQVRGRRMPMNRIFTLLLVLFMVAACQSASAEERAVASGREEAFKALKAGDARYARNLFIALAARAESSFGAGAPETIQAYIDLGDACFSMQDGSGARDAYGKALRIAEGLDTLDLRLVGYLEYKLGAVFMNEGAGDAAFPFLERALQAETTLGDYADAGTVADTFYYLGRFYLGAGNGPKGIEMLQQSRRRYEQLRAAGSPPWSDRQDLNLADVLAALGAAHLEAAAYASAREALEPACATYLRIIGDDDPRVVRAYGNIGICAYYLGDLDLAISLNEKALAILLRHRAVTDPGNRRFYQNLASFYEVKGNTQKAAEYQRMAADAARP